MFHILDRAVARVTIIEQPDDYAAFMRAVAETQEIVPLPNYAIVVIANHWAFVVRPETSHRRSEYFRRWIIWHPMHA